MGRFAHTLSSADIVTGYSRRIAFLGRGQQTVFTAIRSLPATWPTSVHSLQTDNGAEFLNNHPATFAKQNNIAFFRPRPYKRNDNAYIEQKNRQFVREVVGHARYHPGGSGLAGRPSERVIDPPPRRTPRSPSDRPPRAAESDPVDFTRPVEIINKGPKSHPQRS